MNPSTSRETEDLPTTPPRVDFTICGMEVDGSVGIVPRLKKRAHSAVPAAKSGLLLEKIEVMKISPLPRMKEARLLQQGFSLIELLMVMAIMALLLGSSVMGISSYQGQTFTKQAYDMREILASAKASAMAKNTFVWVGFGPTTSNGQKSLVVSAFASRNGLNDPTSSNLNPLMRPHCFPNFVLTDITNAIGGQILTGTNLSSTSANWSLPSQKVDGTAVGLTQAILFSPNGQCFLTTDPLSYIKIGMKPTRGTAVNDANLAALQVSGLTSQVQLFRE
jgi:prepilin-type N-terminal cleavage/methylation domain-containing protein